MSPKSRNPSKPRFGTPQRQRALAVGLRPASVPRNFLCTRLCSVSTDAVDPKLLIHRRIRRPVANVITAAPTAIPRRAFIQKRRYQPAVVMSDEQFEVRGARGTGG
jgi:hypothetical protein